MTTDTGDSAGPDIAIGRRVVMRYQLPAGYPQSMTDIIGELVSLDPPTVRAADGQLIAVAPEQVVAMKALGPRPIRTVEIRALEAAAALGWPGLEHTWIDGWMCRAGRGYTDRANSAVPVGDSRTPRPGAPNSRTLERLGAWYAQRGLPLRLALPDRLAPVPAGWQSWGETVVLGLDIDNLVLPQGPPMVRIAPSADYAWLDMHARRGEETADATAPAPIPQVITAVEGEDLGFAALGVPYPIAIGRGAITTAPDGREWIGLSCIAVAAEHRRHGLGALVCAELIRWGRDRSATHAYVQVRADNPEALALYRDLGFVEHHSYRYAAPPA